METYFATEVVSKTPIRVQHGEIGAANVTDTELLVSGRTGRVGELLQLSLQAQNKYCKHITMILNAYLLVGLFALQGLNGGHLTHRLLHLALLTERLDLLRTTLNGELNLCYFPHLMIVSIMLQA